MIQNELTPARANGASAQPMQINPVEFANLALMFLSRADFKRHERGQFDLCEALLAAIANGKLILTAPPERAAPPEPQQLPGLDGV